MTDKEFIDKISSVVNEAAGQLHVHTIVGILECVKAEVLATVTIGHLISTGLLHHVDPPNSN